MCEGQPDVRNIGPHGFTMYACGKDMLKAIDHYRTLKPEYEADIAQPTAPMRSALAEAKQRMQALVVDAQARPATAPDYEQAALLVKYPLLAAAQAVNHVVNKRVSFVTDPAQHGVDDLWQRPSVTFNTGKGDCEDYAIAKRALLEQMGFPANRMWLTHGQMTSELEGNPAGTGHMNLTVEQGGKYYTLDNLLTPPDNSPVQTDKLLGALPFKLNTMMNDQGAYVPTEVNNASFWSTPASRHAVQRDSHKNEVRKAFYHP